MQRLMNDNTTHKQYIHINNKYTTQTNKQIYIFLLPIIIVINSLNMYTDI